MRTLDNLNRILFNNNCLTNFQLDIELNSFKYNLLLTLSNDPRSFENVSLYFYDISNLKIKNIGGGLIQFMHLQIIELNNGLDRIKYSIQDLEDQKLSFQFFHCDLIG